MPPPLTHTYYLDCSVGRGRGRHVGRVVQGGATFFDFFGTAAVGSAATSWYDDLTCLIVPPGTQSFFSAASNFLPVST